MSLIQVGDFTLRSGRKSNYKIECDGITPAAWEGYAAIAGPRLVFGQVFGVPRGGVPFAAALQKYTTPYSSVVLIAEDVFTTGGSMTRFRDTLVTNGYVNPDAKVTGLALYGRGEPLDWVRILFQMPSWAW